MLMGCTIKSLSDVKVTDSKLYGKKFNHVKGWCGPRQVQSPVGFDSLDDPESWFLKPRVQPEELKTLNKQTNKIIINSKSIIMKK